MFTNPLPCDIVDGIMQKFLISAQEKQTGTISLTGRDAKHISKVLRMKPGEMLDLTDGQGTDFKGEILEISKESVRIQIRDVMDSSTESSVQITVFQGMLKDGKMDTLVRHLTELGITEWVPLRCERAVAVPDDKRSAKRIQRWETISREALKQCGRSATPRIGFPVPMDEVMERAPDFDLKIAFWENAALPSRELNRHKNRQFQRIAVMVGPEGGFSKNEIERMQKAGFTPYLMGPRILRAETAAIAACTLLQHICGDL